MNNTLKEMDKALGAMLRKRQELAAQNKRQGRLPFISVVEHDDDGNIHQARPFPHDRSGKREALAFAEALVRDYFVEPEDCGDEDDAMGGDDPEDGGDVEGAVAELREHLVWKGFSAAVTILV